MSETPLFKASLVESTGILRTHNRKPAILSIAAQFLAVAAILAFPLLHPGTLIPRHFDLAVVKHIPLVTPPVRIPPQPLPTVHVIPTLQPTNAVFTPTNQPVIRRASTPEMPSNVGLNLSNSLNMGTDNPISAIGTGGPASPHITVTNGSPAGSNSASGVHTNSKTSISTGVSAGLLLAPILPVYPAIARAARQSGTVTVAATISTTGRIESAHATEGPAMLQAAAVDAVRSARYRPFLLNGQPTEVNATFSIHFNLSE